jgi:hypothetical protein
MGIGAQFKAGINLTGRFYDVTAGGLKKPGEIWITDEMILFPGTATGISGCS